ncbi:amino acid adenylation domain-containing protein [Microcystis aeruginosa LEGE 11464]|uniref:non-ribosomal peptide synthetase n=1 Tax=Microcystis aeruginosa TaxID=1126 RepID=UPI0018818A1A|nr:non-ribosomal peptide synthetase [Microcystis aeruginosa]MBE9089428.1 amino acid adenylation domain-containing protein [Microcystis aeruginosa LEGE 11464]
MTKKIVEFVCYLRDLGITLEADENRLRAQAPEGVLTATLRQEIGDRKPELLQFLQRAKQSKSNAHLPIQPVARDGHLPLSFAQQRLWFLHYLSPDSRSYNTLEILQIDGNLNLTVLEQSLGELINRHEIFRTTFPTVSGEPIQAIAMPSSFRLKVDNYQDLSPNEQSTKIQQVAELEAGQAFDLTVGPLIQFKLLQLSPQKSVLLLKMHHIIYDGWSFGILIRELSALYEAFLKNLANPLPALSIQYADFAVWQRQYLSGEVLDKQLNYWQEQLATVSPVLTLPTDKPRPAIQTFQGGVERFQLDQNVTQGLKKLGQDHGATLFMTLLAGFGVLLSRYSGQSDLMVGSPIANRNQAAIEPLIGFFANTLALRINLSENPSFLELLEQVKQTTLEGYAHQDLPFEMLVEKLQLDRDLSRNPLVQVMFALQNTSQDTWNLSGLSIESLSLSVEETVRFDLEVNCWQNSEGLAIDWIYSRDLFDTATIARMGEHFQNLVQAIILNPKATVKELPLLTPKEREQLLISWNNSKTDYPQEQCIYQLFEAQVERTPKAIAVVFEEQSLTYTELNHRANQLAHYLQTLGVGAEVLVGISLERSLEMIIGLLGILKVGGAYLPLDPDYPTERLQLMLEDSQVPFLITHSSLLAKLPPSQATLICLDHIQEQISQYSPDNLQCQLTPANLANVIYTSGSTGKPKGVMVEHKGLVNLALAQIQSFAVNHNSRVLQFASFSFDACISEILMTFGSGATLYLAQKDALLPGQPLIERLVKNGITHVTLPPSALVVLPKESLPNLQTLIVAGEACPLDLVKQWSVGRNFFNAYGPTEASVCATIGQCYQDDLKVTIGKAIANVQIYILDAFLQPVPVGVSGELYIGGVGVARGYLNRPELTQEKFIANPFSNDPDSRLYKTGDLARYLPDGNIEYLGRIDNQVKIRGFRIELGEIEAVLSQCPDVQNTAVIVREDTPGDKRLVAYVVLTSDSQITTSELRQFLANQLTAYLVPNTFVILDDLPLTPSGKCDRRSLPIPETQALSNDYIAPKSPTEEILAQIWGQVLKIERVSREDNFFELGGHSLLATQVMSRLRETFQVELPLRSLFTAPSIAALALEIEQSQQVISAPPILTRTDNINLPLSFAQQRLWFLDQLEPNSAFYHVGGAVRLEGTLNITALEQSLKEIINRHEALRTNFIMVNGQATQIIHPTINWRLSVVDCQNLTDTQSLEIAEAEKPFNLAQDCLFRATLFVRSPLEYHLLVTMHHIVSDGWSIGVFFQELTHLYAVYNQGLPSSLTPIKIQYADFAVWQRNWLQGEILSNQLNYWRKQLANAPAFLPLPTDRPRPAIQTFIGSHQEFKLSQPLSQKLNQLSQKHGVTLFMTLLAAFATLLYRYTGQADILVGSPIANRNRKEIEGLIGFFVNTLVLRLSLDNDLSFQNLLNHVREVSLAAYAHQDLPFEMLVEALHPQRDLSHTPLFQVMFVLQNTPVADLELKNVKVCPLPMENKTAKFDLTLSMENLEEGLIGVWEYNTDLFNGSTIERMSGHFVTLLEDIVAAPTKSVLRLSLLTEEEKLQLLIKNQGLQVDYPQEQCIHQLFEAQVERTPDAIAVVFEEQSLTYAELNHRANQLAHYLQTLGVGAEVLVGISLERSLEMIIGLLAILKAGGAYLPLAPDYPTERLLFMLEDSQASFLITHSSLLEKLPSSQATLICLDHIQEQISQYSQDNLQNGLTVSNLANVIYTSGSTGKPKGVMVEHRGLVNLALAQIQSFAVNNKSRVLQFASFSFDACISEILMTFGSGATLYLAQKDALLPGQPLINNLRENGITHVTLPPSALAVLPKKPLPNLQTLIVAGEACPLDLVKQWSVGRNFFNAYGPTEASVCATIAQCSQDDLIVTIGKAIANVQIYILDAFLQPVPVGVSGELYIGGVGVARGYLNRPELTAERFIPNPFDPPLTPLDKGVEQPSKLYKTGDLARYLPDGNIEYLGRIDNQVKIRGFRIELGEIEAVLSQCPDVQNTAVIVREDTPGDKRLVAYVVLTSNSQITTSELRQFLANQLPAYLVPNTFVILDNLPLTPNGKCDRRSLPIPDDQARKNIQKIAPRNLLESQLTQIWSEILGINNIGIQDNFFELGGHSLLAVSLINRIEQKLDKRLPLTSLFQNGTIASLAKLLAQETTQPASSPLIAIQSQGNKTPFFAVHPIGGNVLCYVDLARNLGTKQPFYGLQSLGLSELEKTVASIEEMAMIYIEAIQTVQASGPYYLGGWSMGGVIAFEIAQQLLTQGQEVALLALIDSYSPSLLNSVNREKHSANSLPEEFNEDLNIAYSFIRDLASIFNQEISFSGSELAHFTSDELLDKFITWSQETNLLPSDFGKQQVKTWFKVFQINHQALSSYSPKTYLGRSVFLGAEDSSIKNPGWHQVINDLQSQWISGDHYGLIKNPVLAEKLNSYLA